MTRVKIKITKCQPDDKAPLVSRKDLDKIEWKNEDAVDHRIRFSPLPAPIFAGYGNQPDLELPARGSVEVQLLETAALGKHAYSVSGGDCGEGIDPGAIVVDS